MVNTENNQIYIEIASSWEEVAILVERNSHDSIGSIKRFLNSVPVMDINIDVQNTKQINFKTYRTSQDFASGFKWGCNFFPVFIFWNNSYNSKLLASKHTQILKILILL